MNIIYSYLLLLFSNLPLIVVILLALVIIFCGRYWFY